ncbi:hypothetical protein FH008_04535 [Listeria monocytogenes]|nr:hypothetical protein [Listeria monocytogenes]
MSISAGFNPLFSPIKRDKAIIGVYKPNSKLYVRVNDTRRRAVNTDFSGAFKIVIDNLYIGDIVYFEMKIDKKYELFYEEEIK